MAKLNPYLIDALHAWGEYRRNDDISGTGYCTSTVEHRMMLGTAWSKGGLQPEPEYEPDDDALRVARIVASMQRPLQLVLWATYAGFDGPLSEDEGRQAMGISLAEYQGLVTRALGLVADGLGMRLYVR